MNKKFDISTAKKLISEYADKVNFYMKQNEVLRSQLEDMTTTLNINKNIFYKQLIENSQNHEFLSILKELRSENERVSENNLELNNQKQILESKVKRLTHNKNYKNNCFLFFLNF